MSDRQHDDTDERRFRTWFWQPPRAHGEVLRDRTVTFLELFYDLVYVVVIARAAHTLADDPSWGGAGEFAVVFGLIWVAWINGMLYHELHGRQDGRTRVFVFLQMLLLALLAVFTGDATDDGGTGFALTYAAFLLVVTWLWYSVRRQDPEEFGRLTGRYITGMVVGIVVMTTSAFVEGDPRTYVWAVLVASAIAGNYAFTRSVDRPEAFGMEATDSMVERFGLFTIIVLGEVIVGVVDGLSDVERTTRSVATAMIGLAIGFAYWWTYFDFVGRRLPKNRTASLGNWLMAHLPIAMSIAASGAAIVGLVEHASDLRTPAANAWLLTGAAAVGLLALAVAMSNLADTDSFPTLYRPLSTALVIAAGSVLFAGWWRPAPWALALSVVFLLTAVWAFAVSLWVRLEDPASALPD